MFCRNCGNQMADGATFCTKCGTPAVQTPPQQNAYAQPNYAQPNYAQPNYVQPNYVQPQRNPLDGRGMSIAALVLGICGVVLGWFYFFNLFILPCAVLGIIFGVKGRRKSTACYGHPSGMATAGLVLGIVGASICALGVLTCTICPLCIACEAASYNNSFYYGIF